MISTTRLAAGLLLAFSSCVYAADAVPAYNLDTDVNTILKTFDVPGIAVAIVKDGKVVVAKGFGVRKLGAPAPVDGRTLFEIASNSKAFTAATLAMLVDEGKLSWDDPVTKHLPGFRMYDSYVTGDMLWWPTTNFSTNEIVEKLRYIKPATSFRSRYAYDNLLYIVAGQIIAAKTGKPWGEAVRERILTPLGMNDTTTDITAMTASADYSAPHSKIGEHAAVVKPMPVENAIGAVGIDTSAEDIARWPAAKSTIIRACSAKRRRASCGPSRRR